MTRHNHNDSDAARVLPLGCDNGDKTSGDRLTAARLAEIRQWIAAGHHTDHVVTTTVARELLSQGAL